MAKRILRNVVSSMTMLVVDHSAYLPVCHHLTLLLSCMTFHDGVTSPCPPPKKKTLTNLPFHTALLYLADILICYFLLFERNKQSMTKKGNVFVV
jgi:hypothetical protein